MDLTNKCKYSSSEFISKINIRSERCLQQHLDLLWSSLPIEWTCILNHFSNGDINIDTKHQYILRLDLENSSDLNRGVILDRSPKKIIYLLSVILNFNNSRTKKSLSPWNSILNTDIPQNEIYSHVYEKPQSMHEGDLNWRILHGAISTAKFCFRSGYELSDLCPYCGKQEDLTHLFLSCKRLEPLVHHVQNILECIIPDTASLLTLVFGPTAVDHTDLTQTQVSDQSSPVGQSSSKSSCPARGLTPASQTSLRISCPVQMNQQKTPAGQSSSQASCPVQTTETTNPVDSQLSSDHAALTDGRRNSRVGRMYQHATIDKGPQNAKTTLSVGMYSDQDCNLRHLSAPEIWRRIDRSTGGISEQSTRSH